MGRTRSTISEASTGTATSPVEGRAGRFRLELITPGWGSSAYYPAEVLEAAAAARVFPAGTHMYLDHRRGDGAGLDERGNRSVRDLAAVLAEDAVWDPQARALVGEANVFGAYRDLLGEMKDDIGVSVIAAADVEYGDAEGRRGQIVRELVEGRSVDFVTRAGRGGRIVEILESATTEVVEARNVGQWIESRLHRDFTIVADDMAGEGRLTREERISLSSAIGDALAAFVSKLEDEQPQLYARDIWEDPQDSVATAIEAAKNVTATRPGSTNPNPKENTMGMIEVDEADHRRLTEAAGRVEALESERDTAIAERDEARGERDTARGDLAESRRTTRATTLISEAATEASVEFSQLEVDGLLTRIPLTEAGELDEAAFTTTVAEAAKDKAEAAGAGRPRGFGRHTTVTEASQADVDAMIARRAGVEQKGA